MLNNDVRQWAAQMNKILKDEVVVCAEDLVIPRRFTSGSLALDVVLGGGWPGNQWVELIGRESAGKTLMAYKTIAANQKLDKEFTALWIAAEHYDSEQAAALGVDNARVEVVTTQQMEVAFTAMISATEAKIFDCIVLDSYPALLPDEEEAKEMDEFTTATGARLLNKFIRKAGRASHRAFDGSERPFIGIIINQFRDQIGGFSKFGVPQTSPGGKGKNYFFYCRVEVKNGGYIEEKRPGFDKPVKVGQTVKLVTIKNKSAAPQQTAEVDAYFRGAPFKGFKRGQFDTAKEYLAMAKLFSIVEVTGGGYYHYNGVQHHGEAKMLAALREDEAMLTQLAKEVLTAAADPKALDSL
jgi:recombination protein RecA